MSYGSAAPIAADTVVDELLDRYPATARAFVRRRMQCVGCALARFESVATVCDIYCQPIQAMLDEINRIIREGMEPTRASSN